MIELYGKQIPTTLEELVEPSQSALIIVDLQKDYWGEKEEALFPGLPRRVAGLIGVAREAGVPVIYLQDTLLPGRMSDSAAWMRHYVMAKGVADPKRIPETAVEGTPGQQFLSEVAPVKGETVIKKFRSSGFVGTSLDLMLRRLGAKTCVIAGTATQGCVESTCRDASNEYFVVVLRDCVGSSNLKLHEACLTLMESRYDMADSADVAKVWKSAKRD